MIINGHAAVMFKFRHARIVELWPAVVKHVLSGVREISISAAAMKEISVTSCDFFCKPNMRIAKCDFLVCEPIFNIVL